MAVVDFFLFMSLLNRITCRHTPVGCPPPHPTFCRNLAMKSKSENCCPKTQPQSQQLSFDTIPLKDDD